MTVGPVPTEDGLPWAESIAPDGATSISSPVFAQNIAAVAEYRGTARQIDAAFEEDGLIEVAEVVAGIMWAGLAREVPQYDDQLIAVLERDGRPVDASYALRGTGYLVETIAGRLGATTGGGQVIETTGDAIALVDDPPLDRYVRAWAVPAVDYPWAAGEES